MFFEAVPLKRKRRAHFHEFMLDIHKRIALTRKTASGDPIKSVAKNIATEATLLCFDELHVTDITDAMVLSRLFEQLLKLETIVVATSNAHPTELYRDGLNRQLFLPFVDLIEDYLEIYELDADRDYRLEKLTDQTLYFLSATGSVKENMDAAWSKMTSGGSVVREEHDLNGRKLIVPQASMGTAQRAHGRAKISSETLLT